MNANLKPILEELREQLENFYGERLVDLILYGSQARGDAGFGSDIDVMVVLKGPVDPFLEIEQAGRMTAALSLKYDVVISCVYVSAGEYEKGSNSLFFNVHKEGVPI